MKFAKTLSLLVTGALVKEVGASIDNSYDTSSYNRPIIHLTPDIGWMNDPNGLFYDQKNSLWHAYFQSHPNHTIWGQPMYWGHSTSKDLVNWKQHSLALGPDHDNEGIFSGSVVVDYNNTSGFFDDSIDESQRIVAIYSNNAPEDQTQDIAYSLDGGETFKKYENNPVIDAHSTQFRDPKVFWHEQSSQWIMAVLKSQEYKIQIFGSTDLKEWTLHSNFTSGVIGNQYECPGLIEIPVENSTESKWVMFLAINPGSPLGGSSNQYFIGSFDGYEFKQEDSITRFMDSGKDFYAFQTFGNTEDGVYGLAWASNWQYANIVPTNPWRSSMTLARKYTLDYVNQNQETKILTLKQTPVLGKKGSLKVKDKLQKSDQKLTQAEPIVTNFKSSTGLLDFDLTFKLVGGGGKLEVTVKSQSSDSIRLGYDTVGGAFYFDRTIPDGPMNENPFFTKEFSTYVEPLSLDENGAGIYSIYGVVDKSIVELYINNGTQTMTNTFFMSEGNFPHQIEVATDKNEVFEVQDLVIRNLDV